MTNREQESESSSREPAEYSGAQLADELIAARAEREITEQTAEQLQRGLVLEPNQTLVIDMTPDPSRAHRGYDIGNGIRITGQAIAEFQIGLPESHAKGLVIKRDDAPGGILFLDSYNYEGGEDDTTKPFSMTLPLERGVMRPIGRSQEGQAILPDTVSRDHCAVGLDENGRLILENHEPTNTTQVRKFGKI